MRIRDKILVTGHAGFIGSHLTDKLNRLCYQVSGFDLKDGQDIRDPDQIATAISQVDVVFHLAATADVNDARINPTETIKNNVLGTWNTVVGCRIFGAKLYFASTAGVYGKQDVHPVKETAKPNPSEVYAATKVAGEMLIRAMHNTARDNPIAKFYTPYRGCTFSEKVSSAGLEYAIMRFATVYGPGVKPSLASHIFLGQAMRGEPITVHGKGTQTRNLTCVEDIVDGVVALYESGKMNDTWNITTEEQVSALKMAVDIKRVTGSRSEITHIEQRTGQTFREELSAQKMRDEIGWTARVKWEDGLEEMRRWFVATGQERVRYEMPRARTTKVSC